MASPSANQKYMKTKTYDSILAKQILDFYRPTATKSRMKREGTPSKVAEQYESRRLSRRKVSGFGGKLGGFFKKGRRTGVWKSKVKRKPLLTLAKIQAQGVLSTKEVGLSTTGVSDCVYLGHATFARDQYRRVFFLAILKKLFLKMSVVMKNISDAPPNMNVGDTVTIEHKPNQDQGQVAGTVTYTYAAGNSWDTMATYFVNNIPWSSNDVQFIRIYCVQTNERIKIMHLENSSIEVYCKSSMKLQNATTTGAGAEADDVDNVPVNGKNYFGFGTGTTSGRSIRTEEQFWSRQDCGIMKHVPSGITSGLTEMPTASYFRNVKKMGKHRLNPGKIQTSVLGDHYKVSVNWLLSKLCQTVDHTTDVSSVGKFRFFGFEHVIKAATDAPNIKILGEINYQLGMVFTEKYTTVTDQVVSAPTYIAY